MMRVSPCEEPCSVRRTETIEAEDRVSAAGEVIRRGAAHGAQSDDDAVVSHVRDSSL